LREPPHSNDKKLLSPRKTASSGWNKTMGTTHTSIQKKVKPGWNLPDQILLKCIIEFIYNKLEILTCGIESREKIKEAQDCMAMAFDICKRRTYK
jgi:hypothetical protein